jgi:hypothetical protein
MNTTTLLLILWIAPLFLNLILLYFHKDVETYGDLLENLWAHFIPLLNLIITLFFINVYFKEFWDEFKNKKIKK